MILLGCLFDRKDENEILENSNVGVSNAVNTFQWNLIDGLNGCLDSAVNIINVLPVGTYPAKYKKFVLQTKEWSYMKSDNTEIGCINIPFIKQIMREVKIKKLLRKSKDRNIIIYSAYLPFLKAVKKIDAKVTLIVTDMPEFYDLGKTTFIKKLARRINNHIIYKCIERIDSFVILTEQMKDSLRIGNRPYTVIEGIACEPVTAPEADEQKSYSRKKVLLYTGALHYRFGIKTLLDAFEKIENDEYELWICGSGEAENEIRNLSKKDKRISFFGYCTKEQVYKLQAQASVLINPRRPEGEYTKYSFPSKTMEYMMSGKPVLMYKLDGIPDEYDRYLSYVTGSTADDLKNAIVELCSKSQTELETMGKMAKEWVLKEKNCKTQAQKIIDMIGGGINETKRA